MYKAEMTDTFAGEANYCWVKRVELPAATTLKAAVRMAKRELGISGVRCRAAYYGDAARLDVCGACVVLFVCWED